MDKVSVLGVDTAKNVFSIVGLDAKGKIVCRKSLRRAKVADFVKKLEPTEVGLEACGGSHYWARTFAEFGHEVKLISPQFVRPYVKSNKNDSTDAEAISEAMTRPTMRYVPIKSKFQQDIQSMHRIRERHVKNRTALVNEVRGFLQEYGIVLPQGIWKFRKQVLGILELERGKKLTEILYHELVELVGELRQLDIRIDAVERRLWRMCKDHESVKRLLTIPGIGPLTATALIAAVGDISVFRNARQFAAWLGLVPRQNTTGGKPRLLGISKRGDVYLRKLLIHGARAMLRRVAAKGDRLSQWLCKLIERRGKNRAAVALANKNARIVWALLSRDENYRTYAVAA